MYRRGLTTTWEQDRPRTKRSTGETAHLPRLLDAIARPAVRSGHSQRLSAPVLKTNFSDARPLLRLGAGELHDLGPRLGVGRDRPAVVLRRAGQRDAAKAWHALLDLRIGHREVQLF